MVTCLVGMYQNMLSMFSECSVFTGTGLENWNVSKVKNMSYLFSECQKLKCDLSGWNVSKVKHRSDVFYDCPLMTDDLQPKFK